MKNTVLFLLLLAAGPLFAAPVAREVIPSDYKSSPCAPDRDSLCESFERGKFLQFGRQFKGFSLDRKWIDDHWDEMRAAFLPICGKLGACFSQPGNDATYCMDLVRADFPKVCERFPDDSYDRGQCNMFAVTWYIGLGIKSDLHKQAQACAATAPVPEGPRHLEAWMVPATIGDDFDGILRVYAIDAETHAPIKARIASDGPGVLRSKEGPVPTAAAKLSWDPRLKRVPNADGHTDVVAPTLTISAEGYEPFTLPVPMKIGTMVLDMSPRADEWKPGRNRVTITATDAATGKPVEARVMGGEFILGETNKPFEIEWTPGTKRPEIWVTSLFDKYSDVVVVPAEK